LQSAIVCTLNLAKARRFKGIWMIRVNILFLASRVVLVVSINYEKERWSRQAATLECINACRKKKTHILLDDAILFFLAGRAFTASITAADPIKGSSIPGWSAGF
jgi:hypothetical protein